MRIGRIEAGPIPPQCSFARSDDVHVVGRIAEAFWRFVDLVFL